jgi:hypothetical protein
MTESEWLACTHPKPTLDFLKRKASDRKLRLFAVACCRRATWLFRDTHSRDALELIDGFSDGSANNGEFWPLLNWEAEIGGERGSQLLVMKVPAWWRITMALREVKYEVVTKLAADLIKKEISEEAAQSDLLHDIFGNPFRPIALDPSWLSSTVVKLAQKIYDDRNFDLMPTLANELEKGGCKDNEILAHCRRPGPHIRGCWVLDAVLGKGKALPKVQETTSKSINRPPHP